MKLKKVRDKMEIAKEILVAIEAGKYKVKRIEAKAVAPEFREDSAWLEAIYDVINRTGLAIKDEIEKIGG